MSWKEITGGTALLAILILVAGWTFVLQGQVGDVKTAAALIQRDHDDFKKSAGLLPAMDDRIKKVEGVLELLVRNKDRESDRQTSQPKQRMPSARAYQGAWRVEFRQGSAGTIVFDAIDSKSFTVTGREEREEGINIKGTGEVRDGELVIRYRAKSKKYLDGYNGKTSLSPVSAKLLKGYFINDLGEFDLVTLRREE